ncbi:MAG TPA: ABC transporter permease [Gemmatimonadaceae bacterium]|nr:ABC transporter permease [Gemmatimonadaceae bacterium]
MRKSLLVAQREIIEAVKTKGFWISILLLPILLTISIAAPVLLERGKSVRAYAVKDGSSWLADAVDRESSVSDTRRILLEASNRQTVKKDISGLPPVLQQLAPAAGAMGPSHLDSAARVLVLGDTAAAVTLPDSIRKVVIAAVPEYRAWWDTASAATVRGVHSAPARAKYKRVPAEGDLGKRVADGELFAYFEIGPDPVKDNAGMTYVARNLADDDLRDWYESRATEIVRARRLEERKIDRATAVWLNTESKFVERTVSETGEESAVGMKDKLRQNSPMVFVYILWIAIFSITQGLLTSTIEEKSTRISEVLLSSVSPVQLMAGKILGVAGTGLMMITIWLLSAYAAVKFVPTWLGAPASLDLTPILSDPLLITSFVIYFILGYLLYSAILIGIGSVVNTIQEAQALMMPVMMTLMLPLVAMMPIGRDPNGTFAKVMSYIPPFTPFVMMNRAAGPPTIVEYVVTSILLVAAIAGMLWASAKIFRIGILMTGKPPKAREIWQWVRTPVGVVPSRQE